MLEEHNFFYFDHLLDPILVTNGLGDLIYVNDFCSVYFGISQKRILRHKNINSLLSFFKESKKQDILNDPFLKENYQEFLFEFLEEKKGKALVRIKEISYNDQVYFVVTLRDMTLEETLQKKYKKELFEKFKYVKELESAKLKLEEYSQNLEQLVQKRTEQLKNSNNFLNAMINSLGQGLFAFEKTGKITGSFTKICQKIFGNNPKNKYVWEVLPLGAMSMDSLKIWATDIFKEMIPFEHYALLGPKKVLNSANRTIEVSYQPLRKEDGTIEKVVVIGTDIHEEVLANQKVEEEKSFAKFIENIAYHQDQFINFCLEAKNLIKKIEILSESKAPNENEKNEILFHLHSLKGSSGIFFLKKLENICHLAEEIFIREREMSLAFNLYKKTHPLILESFSFYLGVAQRILDFDLIWGARKIKVEKQDVSNFYEEINETNKEIAKKFKQKFILSSLKDSFLVFEDQVKDLAQKNEKNIGKFVILDPKNIRYNQEDYGHIFIHFSHIFRNIISHGIEGEEERIAKGKTKESTITVSLDEDDHFFFIKIKDDGRGIDLEKVIQKLIDLNINFSADKGRDYLAQFIFHPNFSTKESTDSLSGRGVGLSAVKEAIELAGGTISVSSKMFEYTEFSIHIKKISDEFNLLELAS